MTGELPHGLSASRKNRPDILAAVEFFKGVPDQEADEVDVGLGDASR